jgi:peptidoglycan biosynthesis protein MviN/MurJ (putative lipid II flippase)
MHDTRTPLIINTISTVTNVSLSYYFLFVLKSSVLGMAAAISIPR